VIRTAIFPGRYVQGIGALKELGRWLGPLGSKALILSDAVVRPLTEATITASLKDTGVTWRFESFAGEVTAQEIARVGKTAADSGCDLVVGVGGGKVVDTARAAAFEVGARLAIAPTTASTSAPCSCASVRYTTDHEFDRVLVFPRNPDLVLVDTSIIAGAPARFLIAGIGDALATVYEARACFLSRGKTTAGGGITALGKLVAETCGSQLKTHALSAKRAIDLRTITPSVEVVVEAVVLMGCIGYENGGLAAAHSIANGLTVFPELRKSYHGETIAFTTICQMIIDGYPESEIAEHVHLCRALGLPATLDGLGLPELNSGRLAKVAEKALAAGESIHNQPFSLTEDEIVQAILTADALAKAL